MTGYPCMFTGNGDTCGRREDDPLHHSWKNVPIGHDYVPPEPTPPTDEALRALVEKALYCIETDRPDVFQWASNDDEGMDFLAGMLVQHLSGLPLAAARPAGLDALRDEARLVGQWADAVDPMPDELRAELRSLAALARRGSEG